MVQLNLKRLIAFSLALLTCVGLSSCDMNPETDNPGADIILGKSDFDHYVEYLNGLEDERQEFSNGYMYKVVVQPVQEQKDTYVSIQSVMDGKSSQTDMHYYSIAVSLVIPEGGKDTKFSFELSEYKGDGTNTVLVRASGVMDTAEYDGTLPAFQEYTASEDDRIEDEAEYLRLATEEVNYMLIATATMMKRANLTISALGFTYEVQPLESETSSLPTP